MSSDKRPAASKFLTDLDKKSTAYLPSPAKPKQVEQQKRKEQVDDAESSIANVVLAPSVTPERTAANKTSANDLASMLKSKNETKSKRLNLLIKPSLYAELLEKCDDLGISANEFINISLEFALKELKKR